jgi:hypothetical protein
MPKKSVPNRSTDSGDEARCEMSAAAMRSMRALDYEVQSGASKDLVAQRIAQISSALAELARQVGYPAGAGPLDEAAGQIRSALQRRGLGKLTANARRPPDSHGLADDPVLLKAYCEMAAESMELDNWEDAEPNEEVFEVAREYDAALKKALAELVEKYPPENDAGAEDLWDANGPYLVLMTLRGEGVGIWDGDWVDFYEDTDKAEKFLKSKLGKFADGSGSGKLNEAFMNAASESCGDGEDDDDDSEDDDEDDED